MDSYHEKLTRAEEEQAAQVFAATIPFADRATAALPYEDSSRQEGQPWPWAQFSRAAHPAGVLMVERFHRAILGRFLAAIHEDDSEDDDETGLVTRGRREALAEVVGDMAILYGLTEEGSTDGS